MSSSQNRPALWAMLSALGVQMIQSLQTVAGTRFLKAWPRSWRSPFLIATLLVLMTSACASSPSSSSVSPAPDVTSEGGADSEEEAIANSDDFDGEPTEDLGSSAESSEDDEPIGVALASEEFEALLPFQQEAERLNAVLRCAEGKLYPPAFDGDGSLYKCVTGDNKSLRIFLREDPETESVKNLKILWFGAQVAESETQTGEILQALANYYGGDRANDIEQIFWGDDNDTLETDSLTVEYRYRSQSDGDEHLMVIVPKS
ncbi:MAG: hypothetical protein WBA57_17005 [Elainellaceae cyanobacterium]